MKDIYRTDRKFYRIKKRLGSSLFDANKNNQALILEHLNDLEKGVYVNKTSKSGGRSFGRMCKVAYVLLKFDFWLDHKPFKDLCEEELIKVTYALRKGDLKKSDGNPYANPGDYISDFVAFWRWLMRKRKKINGEILSDICEEIDTKKNNNPSFLYFDFEDLQQMAEQEKLQYKALFYFMFDTGARPQEILNIKRSNILNTVNSDILQVTIPDEVSKTFGRTFKLLLSSKILGRYIKSYKIKPDDYLFNLSQAAINMKMLRITAKVKELPSLKILNNKKKLSMYDFRHSSACYYVPRYKNRSVLMYRFGWKQEKQIEYYTQFLGLKDEITEEDLLTSDEQIGLKKELEIKDKQIQILQEQLASMQRQFKEKRLTLNRLSVRAKSEEGGS